MTTDHMTAVLIEMILNSSKDIDEVYEQFCYEHPHESKEALKDAWEYVLTNLPELN